MKNEKEKKYTSGANKIIFNKSEKENTSGASVKHALYLGIAKIFSSGGRPILKPMYHNTHVIVV